jgi:outer membrane translocation and assembly module TamA
MDSSVFGRNKFGRFELGYQFNTVDNPLYPRKGVKLQTNAAYIQNIDESSKNFVQLTTEASFYNSKGRFTLATRTGVSTNFGDDYEFYQANYLGGLTNLRGYRRDRYAGKTSVYSNTELRFSVSNFNAYITKGTWGLLAFADHGRVWTPGEDSDTWHHGYGGGVWFLPFNKLAMTATYGGSKEDKLVSITAGFLF